MGSDKFAEYEKNHVESLVPDFIYTFLRFLCPCNKYKYNWGEFLQGNIHHIP